MTATAKILLLGSGELGREFVISAKRLGAQVVACDSYAGAPAMQVADEAEVFPMLDGAALSSAIFTQWPTQRVLLMSAHGEEVFGRLGLRRMSAPFLPKPFTDVELLAKAERALREPLLSTAQPVS